MKRLFCLFLLLSLMASARVNDQVTGVRTQALDSAVWENSMWISAVDAEVVKGRITGRNKLAADGCSWFVSDVQNSQKVVSAVWMTAGLGVYDIYVNGELVGEEVLKPGFTHYAKTKLSFTYDITKAFNTKAGAMNQLSAQVTPGWWADMIVTHRREDGMIGKKCAFRGVLELTYADGSKEYFGTNLEDWKAGIAGPVKHAGIFDGERYDARELPGYAVAEKLSTPEINTEFTGEIIPSEGAEVYQRKDLALSPVKAYIWSEIEGAKDGEFGKVVISREYKDGETMRVAPGETLVIDFGQNAAAVPSFLFKAAEGTVLTCLPSEILNDGNGAKSRGMDGPEGSCHRQNLRMGDYAMILNYTFAENKGFVSYIPRCSFFGYRYASITATDEVLIKSIESIPVTSITEEIQTGRIVTGNDLVNKIVSNSLWSMYSNYLSVPTDCPQRDERLGWTADTQVFAETGTFFANTRSFMHKWMRDMRDTQTPRGSYSGVAPLAKNGINEMRLGWADAGIIVPWIIWKQYNDLQIIEENWDSMEKFMDLLNETKYAHKNIGPMNGNYQWADWLSYEPLESAGGSAFTRDANGRRTPLPEARGYWDYLALNYWMSDAEMMRDMAEATGRDASVYAAMYDEAKSIILKDHLNEDGTFKTEILNTMQTPALFALKNKLVEGKAKEDMIARLRENFRQHDDCLQTGFLGTSILMPTLSDNGMTDIAYNLLFQRKNPSWIYSIDNGATTIWERWNSYTIEHGMGPKGMNSFNHYSYGCVCEWIWETAAGIACDASAPGFAKIIMKPVPDKRLGFVEAEYESPVGTIKSSWKYEGDQWQWNFTVPEGAVAEVTVPGENESKEYGPGKYSITRTFAEPEQLKVMSYNIRLDHPKDGDNAWPNRKEATIEMVNTLKPDVFGVQEALPHQVQYVAENLPQYACAGVGRDDGVSKGEHMSIFWNKETVEMVEWGTYWLSETPDVPSYGWDAGCRRTATWALMKDKRNGRKFFFVNTHLDHKGVEARKKGLQLVVDNIASMNPDGYPMVLTGDFNVTPDDECLVELDKQMQSARKIAKVTDNFTTYNGWGGIAPEKEYVIDYIYVSGFSSVPEFHTDLNTYAGKPFISDHYPIVAVLCF